MPMNYEYIAIPDSDIPRASLPVFQHMLDTYASETNKVISVWRCFDLADMSFRPHPAIQNSTRHLKASTAFGTPLLRRIYGGA